MKPSCITGRLERIEEVPAQPFRKIVVSSGSSEAGLYTRCHKTISRARLLLGRRVRIDALDQTITATDKAIFVL